VNAFGNADTPAADGDQNVSPADDGKTAGDRCIDQHSGQALALAIGERRGLKIEQETSVFVASRWPGEQLADLLSARAQSLGGIAPGNRGSLECRANQQQHPRREALERMQLEAA
jgi:hypothetical protein